MVDQKLNILITAKNLAKGVLSGLDKSLGSGAKSAEKLQGGLGGSILKANLLSSAITGGVGLALNAAGSAVNGLRNTLLEAADLQQQQLASVGSFAAVVGKDFEDAEAIIGKFEQTLAKNVAALPGATQGYIDLARAISDEVGAAFTGLNGQLNEQGFRRSLEAISTRAGVLGASSGLRGADTALGVQRALTGASASELRQLSLFERNPALLRLLDEGVSGAGAQSLRQLDPASRVKILEDALGEIVSPELIRRSSQSFQGQLEGFMSNLFDPTTGVFGLLRDLDPNIEGSQNIVSRATKTLDLLLSPNGIFDRLGSLASGLLGGRDPLTVLDSGIASLNSFLEGFKIPTLANLSDFSLSEFLNNAVDSATEFLGNVDFYELGQQWGETISLLGKNTIHFLKNIEWGDVIGGLKTISDSFKEFLIGYFAEVSFNLIEATGRAINDAIGAIRRGIEGIFSNISTTIENTFGLSLGDLLSIVQGALTGGVGGAIGAAGRVLAGEVTGGGGASPTPVVRGRYQGIQPGDAGLLGGIISELAQKPKRSDLVIANTSEAILRPNQAQNLIINSMSAGAGSGGRSAPNITMNVSFAAGTLQEQAEQVIQLIERQIAQAVSGNLT